MQRIKIDHTTTYTYASAVELGEHSLHLRPREGHDIRIESSSLQIRPAFEIRWRRDVYGNSVAQVWFSEPADRLEIASSVTVEQYEPAVVERLPLTEAAENYPFNYPAMEQIDLVPYQTAAFADRSEGLGDWVAASYREGDSIGTLELLTALNRRIADEVRYIVRHDPGVQAPGVTLARGKGSCRDMATLFIEACRHCGLASRFVSGYLVSSAAVEDLATTHAWAEIYLPGAGWRGFDSTSGQLVGADHIAVAVHRHPEAIPPVSGTFFGPIEPKPKMTVKVEVRHL
ncbi:MAG: transglutaminase family protein [Gammaproteobacteria bacterium]|nr:transglutaminase family protein [Gammaproteobacteria bacterium]